jgi:hypothetical protein
MTTPKLILISLLILTLTAVDVKCQPRYFRIMFYNVENLFDTKDDSLTNDNEFLPEGDRHWNNMKFYKKLNNIYKVIVGVGEWEPPALVALCEIENRFVLNQLVYETPLKKFDYKVVHFDSPDLRGIDVGLLYRNGLFKKDTVFVIPINFPDNPDSRTRDILYVKGSFDDRDTIHFFINHWPSRYGGYMQTVDKRNYAASVLKHESDSILKVNQYAKIIIMGDLNDGPFEASLLTFLQAKTDTNDMMTDQLVNLSSFDKKEGTLKYQGSWDMFDQVIVSGAMLMPGAGYKVFGKKSYIFKPDFLLEDDDKYLGEKPFRTYSGFEYIGGFSDHLPVYLDVVCEE